MFELILVTLTLLQSACALQVNLHHRLFVPKAPSQAPFTYKGSIEIDSIAALYIPAHSGSLDLKSIVSDAAQNNKALYQVALELPEQDSDSWPFTSVKACHLAQASEERIWVHVSSHGVPHSISYWVAPTPDNGACPVTASVDSTLQNWNTTVAIKTPTAPLLPQLRVPPPLTPDGKPVEVPEEKTFLQKYWMHILGAFLLISFIAPAPEEE
ncbi:hypothetical protein CPB86DRAFT_662232, partial [Serendipita vermifera]